VYRIALSVAACLRAGTRVVVSWALDADGVPDHDLTDAVAITPGGGRLGSLLSGALDDQLSDLAVIASDHGRLVELQIADVDALVAGLPPGGSARCMLVPATALPADLWERLLARQPVCLVSRVDGDDVLGTTLFDASSIDGAGPLAAQLFAERRSATFASVDSVVTVLWPVTQLVVVGAGPNADALAKAAALLGWHTHVITDVATATGLIAGLAKPDKLVVAAHDVDVAGPALAAGLASEVGYIGALGGQRMQQARADWLAYRGVTDLDRIHGPAGIDIGAETPAEIAVSVLAEADRKSVV